MARHRFPSSLRTTLLASSSSARTHYRRQTPREPRPRLVRLARVSLVNDPGQFDRPEPKLREPLEVQIAPATDRVPLRCPHWQVPPDGGRSARSQVQFFTGDPGGRVPRTGPGLARVRDFPQALVIDQRVVHAAGCVEVEEHVTAGQYAEPGQMQVGHRLLLVDFSRP